VGNAWHIWTKAFVITSNPFDPSVIRPVLNELGMQKFQFKYFTHVNHSPSTEAIQKYIRAVSRTPERSID